MLNISVSGYCFTRNCCRCE
ncbi:hypothetical protein DOY81_010546, partial [Sarcophaga bullata]